MYPKVDNVFSIAKHAKEFPALPVKNLMEKKKNLREVIVRDANNVRLDYENYKKTKENTFTEKAKYDINFRRETERTELPEMRDTKGEEILEWIARKIDGNLGRNSAADNDSALIEVMVRLREFFGRERVREVLVRDIDPGGGEDCDVNNE